MSEAEILLPNLAGGLGLGLGRKYAYLVLPTVLMPRLVYNSTILHIIRFGRNLTGWGSSRDTPFYQLC